MSYTSIPSANRAVGKPVTKDLIDNIHDNLEDLNTRLNSVSLAAGSSTLYNGLHKKPKDVLPIGAIIFGSITAANVTAETDGGEWVAADGSSVSGSDWATLTGRTSLPDIRGRFIRAKANGSGNSPSDLALDSYTADTVISHLHDMSHGHSHTITATAVAAGGHSHELANEVLSTSALEAYAFGGTSKHFMATSSSSGSSLGYQLTGTTSAPNRGLTGFVDDHNHLVGISGGVTSISANTGSYGSTETAPRYVTENVFIKINRAYITTDTRLFSIRVLQQTTINNILVTPVVQGTSGSFQIDIKKGASPTTATQSIFQSGNLPTLAFGATTGVTGLTDSNQNTVAAGQFIVVSVTATQSKLQQVHISISGDY